MSPACPVCGGRESLVVERRAAAPVLQNLVFESPEAARACPTGELLMRRCAGCGFVWNERFDADALLYDGAYDNAQTYSAAFMRHLDAVAERIATLAPANDVRLLEVGCGQGDFLRLLAEKLGDRLSVGAGFDPAWRGGSEPRGRVSLHADYFGPEAAARLGFQPNVVVSRHTIEHVPDPAAFLAAMIAGAAPDSLVAIETPNVDWVLEGAVVFDFFYEHCSLFNPHAIRRLLNDGGLACEAVEPVFDDQYMLAIARPAPGGAAGGDEDSTAFGDLGYAARRAAMMARMTSLLRTAAKDGPVALWGGSSKGVTLTLLLEDDRALLDCAIDINVNKQGGFMPSSALPIVSPEAAARRGVKTAVVVNPAYVDEIERYCAERGLELKIIPATLD